MIEEIKKIIDGLKPQIQSHGGDLEFVKLDEKKMVVEVRLHGSCVHCPMSEMTLKAGVLAAIQEKYPEIKDVVNIAK